MPHRFTSLFLSFSSSFGKAPAFFFSLLFLWNGAAEHVPAWQVRVGGLWLGCPLSLKLTWGFTGHSVTLLVPGGVAGVHACRIQVASEG